MPSSLAPIQSSCCNGDCWPCVVGSSKARVGVDDVARADSRTENAWSWVKKAKGPWSIWVKPQRPWMVWATWSVMLIESESLRTVGFDCTHCLIVRSVPSKTRLPHSTMCRMQGRIYRIESRSRLFGFFFFFKFSHNGSCLTKEVVCWGAVRITFFFFHFSCRLELLFPVPAFVSLVGN